ncbi:hypothetical protein ANRL1_02095 [Anaerolineae bacterium]|nr:hypothetical protein ANRL1_02095 [Anaerolineae bacterium]
MFQDLRFVLLLVSSQVGIALMLMAVTTRRPYAKN